MGADKENEESRQSQGAGDGDAQVSYTDMAVEYVDGSEGMDTALNALEQRVSGLEKLLGSLDETRGEMVSAFNQQTKEIQSFVDSIGRRVSRIHKQLDGAKASFAAAAPETVDYGLPERFARDKDHQEAWRTGRILTAELEAYHPDETREGVSAGGFFDLLADEIEEARKCYEQSVPERVLQEYDYFTAAIEALIARKRRELAQEEPGSGS